MSSRLKFTVNIAVVLLIFAAFKPPKRMGADYGPSLVLLAVAAAIAEDWLFDKWRAKRGRLEDSARKLKVGKWGITLSLLAALILAFAVPAIHRHFDQEEAEKEAARNQEDLAARRMVADPKVQGGIQALQRLRAKQTTNPATTQGS